MHSSQYNGFNFLYNGDYSGDIKIQDDMGNDLAPTTVDAMITVINTPTVDDIQYVLPFRAFVAEAIRAVTISTIEQMSTDEILASPFGQAALEE
jgi:hypothetical protein